MSSAGVLDWHYVRIGACEFCQLEGVRLRTPAIPGLKVTSPPLFCARCKEQFEAQRRAFPETAPEVLLERVRRR